MVSLKYNSFFCKDSKRPIMKVIISQNNAKEIAFYLGTMLNLLSRRVCLTGYTIIIQLVRGKLSSVDGVVVSTVSWERKLN